MISKRQELELGNGSARFDLGRFEHAERDMEWTSLHESCCDADTNCLEAAKKGAEQRALSKKGADTKKQGTLVRETVGHW